MEIQLKNPYQTGSGSATLQLIHNLPTVNKFLKNPFWSACVTIFLSIQVFISLTLLFASIFHYFVCVNLSNIKTLLILDYYL